MGRNLTTDQKARLDAAMAFHYGDAVRWTVPCSWCQEDVDLLDDRTYHRDRILPGGAYTYSNVLLTCVGCNEDRNDQTTGEWAEDARAYGPAAGIGCPADGAWRPLLDARRERRGAAIAARAARRAAVRARRA